MTNSIEMLLGHIFKWTFAIFLINSYFRENVQDIWIVGPELSHEI
jgi:hypothetical protein